MRMTVKLLGVIVALGLLLVAVPARAHHSFAAAFDENQADQPAGDRHQGRTGESPRLDLDRRQGSRRDGDELGHRGRPSDESF